jgi:hypothetical protein
MKTFFKSIATGQCYFMELPKFSKGFELITKEEYNAYYKACGMPDLMVP